MASWAARSGSRRFCWQPVSFLSLYLGFPQIRYFRHAIGVTTGKFDKEGAKGDTSHFQASRPRSGTVGTGNIGGSSLQLAVPPPFLSVEDRFLWDDQQIRRGHTVGISTGMKLQTAQWLAVCCITWRRVSMRSG